MANFYTDELPKVEKQSYYGPTVYKRTSPKKVRGGYRPEDYERYRPQMLREIAQEFMSEDGGFDEEGFYKSALQKMHEAGDVKGVREFSKIAKEKGTDEESRRYKRGQIAKQQLQFLGPLEGKALEIYNAKGPEAANEYYQTVQSVALDMGLMTQEEYDDAFDPDRARVITDYYSKAYGAKKTGSRAPGQLTQKQLADMRKHNEEVQRARDIYDDLKSQGWSDIKIDIKHPGILKMKDKALYSEVETRRRARPKRMKVPKNRVKFLD